MITVAQVEKRFGRVVALDGVSLSIDKGERVAFVGTNGSGKTTLLRAILGLLRVDGKITVCGSDVGREPEIALRSVAYIPQIAPPIEAPVGEVVRASAALRGVEPSAIEARARRLGLDLGACARTRFRDLSGGMKQKLLGALALAAETPILVCDEPTANLDGDARAAFFEQLAERPASSVVILCSHRLEEVRQIVGRVVELADGRIVRDASLSELLRELRSFRVEVALTEAGAALEPTLLALGFSRSGLARFALQVAQAEKIELVTRLLRDHGDGLADLSVVPMDDLSSVPGNVSPLRPKLEVVA
ncbi:MAG: ABC transporter ATP-binding protein [Polyangiaceae bacterium]|nr:ABC transporter ATP-binding protein [Polyangiaceae bacterium]